MKTVVVKIAAGIALLAMLACAVLITKFYFIDSNNPTAAGEGESTAQDGLYNSSSTIVTALFMLGGAQNHLALSLYQTSLQLLLHLRMPIVMFTDSHSADFVAQVRESLGMSNRTKIWNMSLEDLPLNANRTLFQSIIDKKQIELPPNLDARHQQKPETVLDFHVLANSKSYFLANVSADNPFNGTTFAWLDPVYGHGKPSFFPTDFQWMPKFPVKKISLMKTSPANDSLYQHDVDELYRNGGISLLSSEFIAGDKESIGRFHALVQKKVLEEAVNRGAFNDDDQTILVQLVKENPQLFNLVQGEWFNAFHLF